jgi:hypothetical protein
MSQIIAITGHFRIVSKLIQKNPVAGKNYVKNHQYFLEKMYAK